MGGLSKIEWTDATWNPVTGCTKVSQGCKNCYAEAIFHRPYPDREFTDVRVHPDRLSHPASWRKPRMIFVNSMSDLFHEAVVDEFIAMVFKVMVNNPRHTYQVLTKRPERMRDLLTRSEWWAGTEREARGHIWLGVSVEDQKTADERIPLLLQTPAAVRFVSYEPALGPVDFGAYLKVGGHRPPLQWLIAGGESGPRARPAHPDWFRAVRDECQLAKVPFFFKQWGGWASVGSEVRNCSTDVQGDMRKVGKKRAGRMIDGREWNEFPAI